MQRYLYLIGWLLIGVCGCSEADKPAVEMTEGPEVIAAVFAHPDDETTVAPILAKYAAMGTKVHLITTTDGRYGVTDHAKIPAGDSLVAVRHEELICSAEALGLEPVIQLDGKDMLGNNESMDAYFVELIKMENSLERVLDSLRPDVVITFGPEGDSGHPDHRLTGDVTTELLLSGKLGFLPELYYFSYTPKQAERYGDWNLNYTDERYLDTRITFGEDDAEAYYNSIRCHVSQFSPQAMENWIAVERANTDKRIFLRRVVLSGEIREGF
ncbi:PIG-L deacetylase family protein [Lewinella sp. 4G2]|uniref:PIG-L deacetylase family protein n=1 Tax=Lewinella sp. 4G2 TaxID=1803372 RepID=UPI0007B4921F|nr:PIG-L deacetylase family protein [Lewinella sp. 4G2]OAV42583.1 hypothetical protein A3850_015160 [Lewinella sp. 4G2]